MADSPYVFNFLGATILIGTDDLIRLKQTLTGATSPDFLTMHDLRDNTDYQVPSGKKTTILAFENMDTGSTVDEGIVFSDDADTGTNATNIFIPGVADFLETDFPFKSLEIPALKFVDVKTNNTRVVTADLYAIEEDV